MKTQLAVPVIASLVALVSMSSAASAKSPIVLVHGAWETSSIWDGVTAKLRSDGYHVQVVTLPGRPGNPAAVNQITMDRYRQTIADAIAADKRPVVLVGHSFAGFPISVEADAEAVAIMHDAQGEEFKHFAMDLELLLRRTPKWREIAKGVLFQDGDIVEHGEAAEAAADSDAPVASAAASGATASESLGIGGLRGAGR